VYSSPAPDGVAAAVVNDGAATGDRLVAAHVSWVGDSGAVLCSSSPATTPDGFTATMLTEFHRPRLEREEQRIIAGGGKVQHSRS
jgi:serine/threonine protein phosphatase PrpC